MRNGSTGRAVLLPEVAGAMVTGPPAAMVPGLLLRGAWTPEWSSKLRPVVALEVPVLFSQALLTGVGASVGVEYAALDRLSVRLEVPVYYLATAPEDTERFYFFLAPGASFRF